MMFARRFFRALAAFRTIPAAALLCAAVAYSTAQAAEPPKVHGVIATPVRFSGDAGEKVAAAVLELLSSCTASGTASEKEWADAPNDKCRLHFTFARPRMVMVRSEQVEVTEIVVTFPLASGRIWVRSGDKYAWFAKYRPELCRPIQELLKEATPDE